MKIAQFTTALHSIRSECVENFLYCRFSKVQSLLLNQHVSNLLFDDFSVLFIYEEKFCVFFKMISERSDVLAEEVEKGRMKFRMFTGCHWVRFCSFSICLSS
jgi:hypothetical protein